MATSYPLGRPRTTGRSYRSRSVALRNARTGGLLGIETKFLDVVATSTALVAPADASSGEIQPTSGCTGCLSAPAQGDSSSQREGKKIVIKSCLMQGTVAFGPQSGQSTADTCAYVFLALVQDMQTNGATIVSEQVFANPSGSASTASNPFRNMSNTSRFKVLRTKTIKLEMPPLANDTGATGGLVQQGSQIPFTMSWKGIMPVNFTTSSTTADVANVVDNSIHLIAYTTNTSLAPSVVYQNRIRFVG